MGERKRNEGMKLMRNCENEERKNELQSLPVANRVKSDAGPGPATFITVRLKK